MPTFCFKDTEHKKQQSLMAEKYDEVVPLTNTYSSNETSELLQQKRGRTTPQIQNHSNINTTQQKNSKSKTIDTLQKILPPNSNMGIKLICDSENQDMKKYFTKTKLYTNDDITLDYFSKYICFKQNFPSTHKEKISFYITNDSNVNKFYYLF